MTDLSPAAQAVLNAINKELDEAPWDVSFLAGVSASAALRAAADQVVPGWPCGNDCCITTCEQIRADFLAIAAELTAPTLMERALAGDKDAARQFLFEAGFTDEHGQLTGPYKSEQTND
jgi:hypothetical protein